ncbi:MAG: ribosome biogenesis GTPase Der [Parashewanella sp.]
MIPVVALVGRPNVGKSTLFNRLTRTRDALVADFPGLTRDRKYGRAFLAGYEFIVVDTGGIDGTEEGIETKMAEQSLAAIEEADVVLFLTDARAGLTASDEALAKHLRVREKTTFVVANKVDGIDGDSACAEFWSLGLGNVYQMAASQGRGVTNMIDQALAPYAEAMGIERDSELEDPENIREYTEEEAEEEQKRLQDLPIKLAIIGKPNVGKSTLTNRILGEDRVVVYDEPGTTRDSIYIPMERDGRDYVIIDTAGVRRRAKVHQAVEKFSVIKTLKAVEDANVVLLVIDAREGISEQDLGLLGFVLNAGKALVISVNKWDGMDGDSREWVKTELDRRLGFIDFARIHFISALHGTGVGHIFESIEEAYDSATRRVSTAMLTRIMQMAQDDHQPPMVNGRRVKLKYAHVGGYNPPIVVVHGNQIKKLPDSYKRFMMNYFRRSLKIVGTPIQLRFHESVNPFEGKKEKLTLSQERRRKRAMSHIKNRETKK